MDGGIRSPVLALWVLPRNMMPLSLSVSALRVLRPLYPFFLFCLSHALFSLLSASFLEFFSFLTHDAQALPSPQLPATPTPVADVRMLLLVGLPGSGKSTLASRLKVVPADHHFGNPPIKIVIFQKEK